MVFYCDKTLYPVYLIMGPKRPLSGASAEKQNKKVKQVKTLAEKVKILDRLESGCTCWCVGERRQRQRVHYSLFVNATIKLGFVSDLVETLPLKSQRSIL